MSDTSKASPMSLDGHAWWADRQAKIHAAEEEASKEFFADPDAKIPDLDCRCPDCPICLRETDYDEGYYCEICQVWWPQNGYGHQARRDLDE